MVFFLLKNREGTFFGACTPTPRECFVLQRLITGKWILRKPRLDCHGITAILRRKTRLTDTSAFAGGGALEPSYQSIESSLKCESCEFRRGGGGRGARGGAGGGGRGRAAGGR